MNTLCIEYPESLPALSNQSAQEFESEARMALATKLFELGRLTSGQAATLVGIPRARFLLECGRFGVASVSWDEEELAVELDGFAPRAEC
jgi:predicted HTH domain antitoxin